MLFDSFALSLTRLRSANFPFGHAAELLPAFYPPDVKLLLIILV
jgi:hypothetical protein